MVQRRRKNTDCPRKIIGWDLRPDEPSFAVSDVVEMTIENAKHEGHLIDPERMPKLYTDNGSGFASGLMDEYLSHHGIEHIFGTPYYPQGRGKIECLNRRIKEKLCLLVYCSPDQLRDAIDEAVRIYNQILHKALQNVSPNDVHAGRKEEILKRRQEKKKLTVEQKKRYNLNENNDPDQLKVQT